ncbi:putative cytochrome P450 142 [Mycobacterium kiyosense]|uniref:Cytochrome P450 142 n=2 Tax=Mycobacteriaceae TaxID=1762 RepID=A0A9P3Q6J1_9MYCO|nr:putative cytochrome P450 142 [Mycobacterium kiyosense]BDE11563.1 putative cytochrome P450 142 [Mycobacterium sp. 20KCMC460]GLB82353.1 putative cytochrome P450 142 [Mycobacterium kiyosense]GLB88940.1 putative cytochrome P450 142 [Mycobacterium kiyosense]GLB95568.1 putative cytochrome P450 142 [Mycobacterium kiyosense]
MRQNRPVFRDRNGLAAAATYRAVIEAERDPGLFSNAGGIRPHTPPLLHMIDMDDPAHLLRRKLVNHGFTRKRVAAQVDSIQAMCDALVDAVCERGTCDFVADIAAPLPMAVIGDMLGVAPAERDMFLAWSDDMVVALSSTASPELLARSVASLTAYNEHMHALIGQRRSNPGDDLVSVLVAAEVDGRRLSDDEIAAETLLILIGGDETTRHTLSGGVAALLQRPEQWEALRADPKLLGGAIEEMLRWTSPVKNMCRILTADTDFHGTRLHAGEKIMLLFESANFDEAVFVAPDDFDIHRNPNNHLAFGFGTHFCLGNQLARMELTTMVGTILRRLPDLSLPDGAQLPLRPANFVSGLESMPVTFSPVFA